MIGIGESNQKIVGSGLILQQDSGQLRCYSGSETSLTNIGLGTSNVGTLFNGVGFTASNGGVFTFDGSNDYIQYPWTSAFNTGSVTILVFATAPNLTNGQFRSFVSKNGGSPPSVRDYSLYAYNDTGTTGTPNKLHFSSSAGQWIATALPSRPATASWHQWGAYANGSSLASGYIYDGVKYTQSNLTTALAQRNYNLQVGRGGEGTYTNSTMGVVLVYNRELTSSEVTQNYDALRRRYGL